MTGVTPTTSNASDFTLTYQNHTYPMTFSYLPSKLEFPSPTPYQKGTGTVVVSSGSHKGTYSDVPVYDYDGELWVWPDLSFSGYTALTVTGKLTSLMTQVSKTPITELIGVGVLAALSVSAVVVLSLRSRHRMRDQIRSDFNKSRLR